MPFIVEKFVGINNTPEYEKVFWDYEDAQDFVAEEVFRERDNYEKITKDRHPGVKVNMSGLGVIIKYKGTDKDFILKVSEKSI